MTVPVSSIPPRSALDRARAILRDRPFVVAGVAAISITLFTSLAFTPRYETNDDVTMHLIAAGLVFTDRPDEHLLFSNVLIGLALKTLYTKAADVPWYAIYQLATLTASAAAAGYALLRVNPSIRQACVVLLYLVVAVLPCIVELQFTKTAFLAAFSGLLLLLAPLRGARAWSRVADVAGCALVIWGSLIRFESLLLAGIVAVPVAIAGAYADPRRAAWRAIPLAVALAAALGLNQFNRSYYARGEGWEDFYAYNAARAKFTDYDRYRYTPETRAAFRAAGWESVDLGMLQNWFFADRNRYSLSKLKQIIATVPRTPPHSMWQITHDIVLNIYHFPDLIRLMLAVVCAPFLTGIGRRQIALPAVLFGLACGLTVVLGAYFRIPARVAIPLFAGALLGGALRSEKGDRAAAGSAGALVDQAASHEMAEGTASSLGTAAAVSSRAKVAGPGSLRTPANSARSHKTPGKPLGATTTEKSGRSVNDWTNIGASVFAAGLIVMSIVGLLQTDNTERQLRERVERTMRALNPQPDQLFVLWREWFPLEKVVYPLKDTRALRNFQCLPTGVLTPTPFAERRERQFGITDVYLDICRHDKVYLVAVPQLIDYFRFYVQEHYGRVTTAAVLLPIPTTSPSSYSPAVFLLRDAGVVPRHGAARP
jgi:hypothetical protein